MKIRNFLSIVPQAVKRWALVIVGCAVPIGLIVGYHTAKHGAELRTISAGGGVALLGGILLATWLLCIGFVFADARRRAMRPLLWVLVAALFPHLLGFLLYFVLRQPIASPCTHCGQTISLQQRFCAWCGTPQHLATSGDVGMAADQC